MTRAFGKGKAAREEFRRLLEEDAEKLYNQLIAVADGQTKQHKHRVVCTCGRSNDEWFTVEDWQARLKATELLFQYGWGRPDAMKPTKDLTDLLEKDPASLTSAERTELLAELRQKMKGGSDGSQEDPSGVQVGAEEDRGE